MLSGRAPRDKNLKDSEMVSDLISFTSFCNGCFSSLIMRKPVCTNGSCNSAKVLPLEEV
jgi:hypothetical protein